MRALALVACLTALVTGAQGSVTWLILVDEMHTSFVDSGRLRTVLRAISSELIKDSDRVLVRSTMTPDRLLARMTGRDVLQLFSARATGMALKATDVAPLLRPAGKPSRELELRDRRAQDAAVELIAQVVDQSLGQPIMIVVSSGWPLGPQGAAATIVVTRAKHVGVPIVTIDPRHVQTGPAPPGDPATREVTDAARASLQALAEQTGGLALLDQLGIDIAMQRVKTFARR